MKPPLELFSLERKGRPSCRVAFSFWRAVPSSQSASEESEVFTENWQLRTRGGTTPRLHAYNTVYASVSSRRSGNVLRSMWCAVASGRATLRTMRQNRTWTHRASTQPGSRSCPTGRHSLDGILGVACARRSGRDRGGASDLRPRDSYSQRPTARGQRVAAAPAQHHRMGDSGEIRGRLLHWLGLAAAGAVGANIRAGDGFRGAAECPARYCARSLYTMGAAARAIR